MQNKGGNIRSSIVVVSTLLLGTSALHASTPPTAHAASATRATAKEPAIDPEATGALTRVSIYLKTLPAFAVRQYVTREQVINGDLKVQKASAANIVFRRPDGLRADVTGDDDKNHSIFFDGKDLTVYMPTHGYYAQMAAPGTVTGAMDTAESSYGVEFPAPDFLRLISGEDFAEGLTAAGHVGKSRVGDTDCEHYAFRNAEVDYQLWVASGDRPLPRKLVITSKKLPSQPEYTAIMTWDTSPKIDAREFAFVLPKGVTRIPFGMPPTGPQKNSQQHK